MGTGSKIALLEYGYEVDETVESSRRKHDTRFMVSRSIFKRPFFVRHIIQIWDIYVASDTLMLIIKSLDLGLWNAKSVE